MRLAAAFLAVVLAPQPAHADPLREAVAADTPALIALYRDLHANPELSMQEVATAAKLAAMAKRLGFDVTTGVGKTGVVAVLRNGPGPVLMIRADMDALPVTEQTGLSFASRKRGVMHACGHDTHMSAWIGTARRLTAMKAQWSGTLVMILEPGEEIGAGARAMLDDGLFRRFPKPSHALAFHDAANLPAGMIGYTPGPALANVDSVDLQIRGVGGHGAYPHTTRDPIVLASRIVTALQTLVSREADPQDPAVVTVGSFHAGTKHNVVPDEANLLLTVRSYTDRTRRLLLDGIRRIVRGEAIAAGLPEDRMPVVTIREAEYTPAAFNTEKLTSATAALLGRRFGPERIARVPASMGGEDFGRFHLADRSIESLIFWVGGTPRPAWEKAGGDPAKLPSLHSPFWAPDAEAVISTATEAMTATALDILRTD